VAESVSIEFKGKDQVSGPADRAARALAKLEKQIAAAKQVAAQQKGGLAFQQFQASKLKQIVGEHRAAQAKMVKAQAAASKAWEAEVARTAKRNADAFKLAQKAEADEQKKSVKMLKSIGGLGLGAAKAVGAFGLALGVAGAAAGTLVVKQAAFVQTQKGALGLLLKSKEAGEGAFRDAQDMAVKYGLSVEDTVVNLKKLLAAQFSLGQAKEIVMMTADLKALGATETEVDSVVLALKKIKSAGKLQGDELNMLTEAGVSAELVYKEIGKILKKDVAQIQKMQAAGTLNEKVAIEGIKNAVKAKLNIQALGDAALMNTKTLAGMWDVMKARAEKSLMDIGEKVLPKLIAVAGPMLTQLTDFLAGPEGAAMVDSIASGFVRLVSFIGEAAGAIKSFTQNKTAMTVLKGIAFGLAAAFGAVATVVALVGAVIGAVAAVIFGIGFAIGAVISFIVLAVQKVIDFFRQLWATVSGAASSAFSAATSVGAGIVNGILSGLSAGASLVASKARSLASSAIQAAKEALKIGSPSRVFEGFGLASAQGFAIGLDSPLVPSAAAGVFDPGGLAQAMARGGNRTNNFGGVSTNATISVSGAGDPAAVAAAVQAVMVEELAGAFEQLNIEVSGG
jgi:tape measure domain-containing protein